MNVWSLIYYETATGRCPVLEFLKSLNSKERARVRYDLDLLNQFGLNLGAPYVDHLEGKVWELRTTGRPQHRTLYFAATGQKLVLLHGFTKKTRKTPPSEIETAKRRMLDYLRRSQDDEKKPERDYP